MCDNANTKRELPCHAIRDKNIETFFLVGGRGGGRYSSCLPLDTFFKVFRWMLLTYISEKKCLHFNFIGFNGYVPPQKKKKLPEHSIYIGRNTNRGKI